MGLVLLQRGKGAEAGAAFGSGASGTVFGARGSANFLSRTTAVLATAFFLSSLGLAYLGSQRPAAESLMESVEPSGTEIPSLAPLVEEPAAGDDLPSLPVLVEPDAAEPPVVPETAEESGS
jgi:preprotein translocase subunit SecG